MKTLPGHNAPIPAGSWVLITVDRNGSLCPTVLEKSGLTGISDSKFMAVLSLLGHDPISDVPSCCGPRAWWWFDDPDSTIRKMAAAYYAKWTGNIAHLSFVRAVFERAHGFAIQAKSSQDNSINGRL